MRFYNTHNLLPVGRYVGTCHGGAHPSRDTPTMQSELPLVDVDVPREVAREAAEIADRENLAIEDALQRLTVYHRKTEGEPWVPPEAPVMVVVVDTETEDWASRFASDHDLPTTEALARVTAYDYPTDVVRKPGAVGSSAVP